MAFPPSDVANPPTLPLSLDSSAVSLNINKPEHQPIDAQGSPGFFIIKFFEIFDDCDSFVYCDIFF